MVRNGWNAVITWRVEVRQQDGNAGSGISRTTLVLHKRHSEAPAELHWGQKPMESTVFGSPGRTRTCDILLRRQALYPMSYGRAGTWIFKSEPLHTLKADRFAPCGRNCNTWVACLVPEVSMPGASDASGLTLPMNADCRLGRNSFGLLSVLLDELLDTGTGGLVSSSLNRSELCQVPAPCHEYRRRSLQIPPSP